MIKKTMKRNLILGAIIVIVAFLLLYGFKSQPLKVEPFDVRQGAFSVVIREEGKTRVKDRYIISAPVMGDIERVELEPGDEVKAGEVLFRLKAQPSDLLDAKSLASARTQLKSAQAQMSATSASVNAQQIAMELAKKEWLRLQKVAKTGLVASDELDRAKANFQLQNAELSSLQFQLQVAQFQKNNSEILLQQFDQLTTQWLDIKAPIAGTVLQRYRESAGPIMPGTQVLELGDIHSLELEVDVLSADAVKLKKGMRVKVSQWGGDHLLDAIISRVDPSGFTKYSALGVEEQRVWVIAQLTSSTERFVDRLGDGFRVEAEFILWQGDQVIQIPTSALIRDQDHWYVFRLTGNKVQKVEVKKGRQSGLWVQILDGLKAQETVVRYPNDQLADGATVSF